MSNRQVPPDLKALLKKSDPNAENLLYLYEKAAQQREAYPHSDIVKERYTELRTALLHYLDAGINIPPPPRAL